MEQRGAMAISRPARLRTLLALGRVSNLPTVWSNCLAGWILAGGGPRERFLLLCVAASFLYVAGMYLNDAFDAEFDRQHRHERPIPSGAISRGAVWALGLIWLCVGLAATALLSFRPWAEIIDPGRGKTTMMFGALLGAAILVYDAVHKAFVLSPVLMAICRFLLIALAASAGFVGITGLSIWTAIVMAAYIVGLSYIARHESLPTALRYWPCIFLAAPVVLALIVNRGSWLLKGVLFSTVLVVWIFQALRNAYWTGAKQVGRCVSGLLAGIVLVDLLSVADAPPQMVLLFAALFALALLFQQFVPAT